MRKKRLLLATAALSSAAVGMSCRHEKPVIYANTKGSHYDHGSDAGVDDGQPQDAAVEQPTKAGT